jgi:LysR family nitrogen assimilation transcriptional regulator
MDLRRLMFLVRVIDMGSITRAAGALGIAQPALSQHIQVLERNFETALLIRGQSGVVPTEAGWIAYRNAKVMLRQIERARAEVKVLADVPSGKVGVGIAPHSHARQLIQPLLQSVRRRYPDIVLHISENFEGVLASDVRAKRLDMALFHEVLPKSGFSYKSIFTEPLALLASRAMLPAAPGGFAGPGSSFQVPLVLPSPAHALRQLIDAVFSKAYMQPLVVAEIESFETLIDAVRCGIGATILPMSVAMDLAKTGELSTGPFGASPSTVTLSLCTAEDEGAPSAAVRVVHALVGQLSSSPRDSRQAPDPAPPAGRWNDRFAHGPSSPTPALASRRARGRSSAAAAPGP